MDKQSQRFASEQETITAMVGIYCCDRHGVSQASGLCAGCRELRDYALQRLEKCPFGEQKPSCSKCTVHCYKPAMQARIREVMRYAGPRLLTQHPWLAAQHLLRGLTHRPSAKAKTNRRQS